MTIRRKILPIAVFGSAMALTGCVTSAEMQARHAATCASYGFVPGSEGYAVCMLQLDMADHGYSHHGIGSSGQAYLPYPLPPPPPSSQPTQPAPQQPSPDVPK